MKKERVLTVIVVVLALVFSAGSVLADGWSIPFSGTIGRGSRVTLADRTIKDCWLFIPAPGRLTVNPLTTTAGDASHLIDGEMISHNIYFSREITSYPTGEVDANGDPIVKDECVAGVDFPDPDLVGGSNLERGIVHGQFTLKPDGANGGVWNGTWKILYGEGRSNTLAFTATAKGFGGDLAGLKLEIFGPDNSEFDGIVSGSWYTKRPR
jgi:hypothetical protein